MEAQTCSIHHIFHRPHFCSHVIFVPRSYCEVLNWNMTSLIRVCKLNYARIVIGHDDGDFVEIGDSLSQNENFESY